MATTTKITLKPFNLDEALAGAVLGFSTTGDTTGTVSKYVLNFKKSSESSYVGYVGNVPYKFNSTGGCHDGVLLHKLFIIEASITETKGTASTRVEGVDTELIDVDVIQPREEFAIAALKGILSNISNPLELNDAAISLITDKAFKIAQSMMNTAADYRAATSSVIPESVDVDINNLTSTTDRILYNLNGNLKALVDNGFKMVIDEDTPITVKPMNGTAFSTTIVNSEPIDTYVTNMPNVPTEPVEITGTVTINEETTTE